MLGRFFRASPMFELFRLAPEGERLLSHHARLAGWWDRVSTSAKLRADPGGRRAMPLKRSG